MNAASYPEMVQALLLPEAYPQGVAGVELVETHVSYLFLTGEHVYKVKKPVDYGFLDFTTVEKRRYFCHQEVALNCRMSPEVYLGVSEVRQHRGRYTVDGPGVTVEYAVKMRQLPRQRAMSLLLQQGQVSPADIRRLVVKIARFHARAPPARRLPARADWSGCGRIFRRTSNKPGGLSVCAFLRRPVRPW